MNSAKSYDKGEAEGPKIRTRKFYSSGRKKKRTTELRKKEGISTGLKTRGEKIRERDAVKGQRSLTELSTDLRSGPGKIS